MSQKLECTVFLTEGNNPETFVNSGDKLVLKYGQSVQGTDNCEVRTEDGVKIGIIVSAPAGKLEDTLILKDVKSHFEKDNEIYGIAVGFETKANVIPGSNPILLLRMEIVEKTTDENGNTIKVEKKIVFKRRKTQQKLNRKMEASYDNDELIELSMTLDESGQVVAHYENGLVGKLTNHPDKDYFDAGEMVRYVKAIGGELNGTLTSLTDDAFVVTFDFEKIDLKAKEEEMLNNAFSNQRQRILSEGILTEVELDERLKCFEFYHCPLDIVLIHLERMRILTEEEQAFVPKRPETLYQDITGNMLRTLIHGTDGHLMYNGPKATGKNVAIRTLAWLLNRPLFEVSLNRQTDASDLLGDKTLTDNTVIPELTTPDQALTFEENQLILLENLTKIMFANNQKSQSIEFVAGPVLKAMEMGGVLCLDEINTTTPALMSILNSILDKRGSIYVPGYGYVQAHPNFLTVATMNAGYNGTTNLNEALNDRFTHLLFEYQSDIKSVLRSECPLASNDDLEKVSEIYTAFIDAIRGDQNPLPEECMSVRGFIAGLRKAKHLGLRSALIDAVVNKVSDRLYREAMESIIDLHI